MRPLTQRATFAAFFTALAFAGCAESPPAEAAADGDAAAEAAAVPVAAPDRADLRAATERYADVQNALADGYIPDPTNMCVTAAMEGAPVQLGDMGIHYFRPDVLGITGTDPRVAGTGAHTDFASPGVLIYEPQADGSLALVAIENVVFQAGWEAAGNTGKPVYEGQEFYHMVDNPLTEVDEAHGFEPHYELHLWLYRDNPAGEFAQFNTQVTCDHHRPGPVAMR